MEVISWLIDGLNGNAGAITGIATVVLVVITAYYARVTKLPADTPTPLAQLAPSDHRHIELQFDKL